ncbi:MAG: hypothetical protein AAGC97_16285 [Planctomycetota bacterium]
MERSGERDQGVRLDAWSGTEDFAFDAGRTGWVDEDALSIEAPPAATSLDPTSMFQSCLNGMADFPPRSKRSQTTRRVACCE